MEDLDSGQDVPQRVLDMVRMFLASNIQRGPPSSDPGVQEQADYH